MLRRQLSKTAIEVRSWTPETKYWLMLITTMVITTQTAEALQVTSPNIPIVLIQQLAATIALIGILHFAGNIQAHHGAHIAIAIIITGAMLNTIVQTANGGYMPVTGLDITDSSGIHIPADNASIIWLGDWIFNCASPGDVLLVTGLIVLAYSLLNGNVAIFRKEYQK